MTLAPSCIDYHEVASGLALPSRAFIDGDLCDSRTGSIYENINPASGSVLGTVAACDHLDVNLAVCAARRSFDAGVWSRKAPEERKQTLLKLAALIETHAVDLAVMESLDSGKTITDCLNEIRNEVPTIFRWYAELCDKLFGKVAPTGEHALAFLIQEPIGVAGLVIPWNFPLLMATWKLAPALASGCSVVLKPAEQTPLTALRLAELAAVRCYSSMPPKAI